MKLETILKKYTVEAVQELYGAAVEVEKVIINETRKEFEGDLTVVIFQYVKLARKKPMLVGQEIATFLQEKIPIIESFNLIQGFINIVFTDQYWLGEFQKIVENPDYGQQASTGKTVLLEYIGPNTNKPLHLGHIRNMFIGFSTANILSANGHDVHKVTIYNDRGIAICKSMIAWQKEANGATPASTGTKGDHFVGSYYVAFNRMYQSEVDALIAAGKTEKEAKAEAPILLEAREMLLAWEAGDAAVRKLWKMMNDWVYEGFFETYRKLGVDYEKAYLESDNYLSGKGMVNDSLAAQKDGFYKKADGSVWVNLEADKLDHKLLLRSDSTSVYITQDLGIADLRYQDYAMDQSIYVVGNEQDYHFQALKATLTRMEKPYAAGIYHLSYGMVDLPSGKMKSREGTTVDADDLVQEMLDTAAKHTAELGKTEGFEEAEAQLLYNTIGLGALKYFMLKVNPQKRMLFNPAESIDFLGNTGPFIQYTHARIQSILRKYKQSQNEESNFTKSPDFSNLKLEAIERELIRQLHAYEAAIVDAGRHYDPSVIASYAYQLAKTFNKLYNELPILNNEKAISTTFRVYLAVTTARNIRSAMKLLGVNVPDRM